MNKTNEILERIYKNVKMGSESITTLLPKVGDDRMISDLTTQLTGYEDIACRASNLLRQCGLSAEEEGFMKKIPAKAGIMMNIAIDATSSHIAEMMIQGSNMGIVDMTKYLNEAKRYSVSKEAVDLANEVVTFEENNIQRLKAYL